MRLLMVHGRSQGGLDPLVLKNSWLESLNTGLSLHGQKLPDNVAIDFPYYGDLLDRLTAESLKAPADVAKAARPISELQNFQAAALLQIKDLAKISDAQIAAELGSNTAIEKGVQNWSWIHAIARFVDKRLTGASDFTIERFLTDVFLYLTVNEIKHEVEKAVIDTITEEPTIIIAHSLGTIVAYNVLLKHSAQLNIKKFITLGSPLGIVAISSKLGSLSNPAGSSGWYNAFDARDVVALNPLDKVHFGTERPVMNNGGVNNQTANRHGITGYLGDPAVAANIIVGLLSR